MTNHRSKGGTENNPYPSDFYDCSTYTLAHQKRTHACRGHYIRTKAVRKLVLETIRTASTFAIGNQDEFMKKVRSASQIRQVEVAKDTKRTLNKDRKRIAKLDTIIKSSTNLLPLGALPMNALILCLQNTKRIRKLLSHLYRMQNRICPLLRKILTVRRSSFHWQRSTPTFLN